MNLTKEHLLNSVNKCDRSVATTDPSDLSTLDEPSLQTLIDHYLSVREKLPDSVRVRDRIVELQQELLNRTLKADAESEANNRSSYSSIEGVIRQTTDNPIQ